MWSIWRERNALTFDISEHTVIQLKSQFLRSLHGWEQAVMPATASFILDFIDSGCSYVYCSCTWMPSLRSFH
jgi:hypothetical protein